MDVKKEGPVFPPVPLRRVPAREGAPGGGRPPSDALEPRCEMCGAPVITTHCKRICLRCGFMTGCSEGV